MRTNKSHLPLMIAALAALMFACISVQDNARSSGAGQGGQQNQSQGGFTVSETTVPGTPASGSGTSSDGFTVESTAVPNK